MSNKSIELKYLVIITQIKPPSMHIIKKLYSNLIYSLQGLKVCCSEIAFRLELLYGFILAVLIIGYRIEKANVLILIIEYVLLLAFELINTAIEKTCNRITLDRDLQIQYVKDLASAAVFLLVLLNASTIIYCIVFF